MFNINDVTTSLQNSMPTSVVSDSQAVKPALNDQEKRRKPNNVCGTWVRHWKCFEAVQAMKFIFGAVTSVAIASISAITPANALPINIFEGTGWETNVAPENRKIPEDVLDFLKEKEGMRLEAYDDLQPYRLLPKGYEDALIGTPTIGFGSTHGVELGDRITASQAHALLVEDTLPIVRAVEELVKVPLTLEQSIALTSFTFNVGVKAFSQSTLLKMLNAGDYRKAADQFDRWVYSKGTRVNGLVRRRAAEKAIFLDEKRPSMRDLTQGITCRNNGVTTFGTITRVPGGFATAGHVAEECGSANLVQVAPDAVVTLGSDWMPEKLKPGTSVMVVGVPPSSRHTEIAYGEVRVIDGRGYQIVIDRPLVVGGYSGSAVVVDGKVTAIVYAASSARSGPNLEVEYWLSAWAPSTKT